MAVVLFSLGAGMAACVAAFSMVNTLVFAEIPGVADRSTLLRIGWSDGRAMTLQEFEGMEGSTAFDGLAAQGNRPLSVSLPSEPAIVPAAFVSPAFFQVLGTRPVAGRLLVPADADAAHTPVLVIDETLWRSAFGSEPDVIGVALVVGGRSFTIVGITPAGFPGLASQRYRTEVEGSPAAVDPASARTLMDWQQRATRPVVEGGSTPRQRRRAA